MASTGQATTTSADHSPSLLIDDLVYCRPVTDAGRAHRHRTHERRDANGEPGARANHTRAARAGYWFAKWVVWRIGLPVFVISTLPAAVTDAAPSWQARWGSGIHGTFTATRVECNKNCFWHGDFTSQDGTVQRADVGSASGGHVNHIGQQAPALDTGDEQLVYPSGGGWDWLIVLALILAEIGGMALWVLYTLLPTIRWIARSLVRRRSTS